METEIHNKNWSQSIAKYGVWYLLSSVITKGLGIILLPIYTKYLTPHDYGILQTINSIAAFLPFLLSLSLDAAFGRFYHEAKRDSSELTSLFSTVYWFVFAYGLLMLLLLFMTTTYWFFDTTSLQVYPYAYIAFIPILFNQLALLGRTFLQQSLETKKSTTLDVVSTLINAGLSVILLIYFNKGVMSRLIGVGCGSAFLFVFYHCYFIKIGLLKYQFNKDFIIMCLRYSLPMLPAVAGSWISTMSDRLVIAKYCSMTDVGLYSLAFQLGQLLYLLGDAITRVVSPLIMSGLVSDKENTRTKIAKSSYQVFLFMLFANMGMFVFSGEFISIFADEAYSGATLYIPLFAFSYVIGMQQRYPVSIISYKKKTWIISLGCILMALINLGLNLFFVPKFGYPFAVWAFVAANVFYTIWTFIWSQRYENIPFRFKKLIKELIIFIVALLLVLTINKRLEGNAIILISLKILEIVIYGYYMYKQIKNNDQ